MLNVGFILPSSDYLFDPFRGDPQTHLYLLTVLESHFGDEINPVLIDLRGIKKEFAHYHIPECDAYLYTGFTLDYNDQIEIVQYLRRRYPKAKHLTGGPHPNVFPEECLKIYDSVILGEGEESIIKAMNDLKHSDLKRIYKQESPIDLNRYPYARRKFLPGSAVAKEGLMTLKNKEGFDKLLGTTVIFSRGCPFYCFFCAMPYMKKHGADYIRDVGSIIRYRSPELIEEEIEYLKREYHIQGINLIDEIAIPMDPAKAIPHLEAFGRTGIRWRGQCRVNGFTSDIAKLARECGCMALGLGVESVSQRALDYINKKINVNDAKETIKVLKDNDIEARVFLVVGLPGEPSDIVERTWDFIQETKPDMVLLSLFTVRPGTIIYNNPKKFGIKSVNTDWERTMHLFSRYENEIPTLTFEYEKETPWGRGFTGEEIVKNYLELQTRLKETKLGSFPPAMPRAIASQKEPEMQYAAIGPNQPVQRG